ncbi:hypothetical protein E4U42_000192 [Claviceps africana]|uniref:cutinase n=1 Tax=Claviceps africana TaxID=83212 RepID=A0A8K0J023_9HYPO|nr:hypothetical protein E4U42_000192 [Claviceps africana]
MKSFALASLFTVLVAAAPTPAPKLAHRVQVVAENANDLDARQAAMGMTRNDLENGQPPCPRAIFIFARGSTEPGNMGASVGPIVADTLTKQLGQGEIWIQGVGGAYTAGLVENALPGGSSPAAIQEMKRLLTLAHKKCPKSTILAGGYSQGAALAADAVSASSKAVREQIGAVVLFGYTKNQQNAGKIPNYPADRVKVFCNAGDMVCTGSLFITPAHLNYAADAAGPAPQFLESKVSAASASTSRASRSKGKTSDDSQDSDSDSADESASPAPASAGLSSLAPASGIPGVGSLNPMGNVMSSFMPTTPALGGAATANPLTSLFKGIVPRWWTK